MVESHVCDVFEDSESIDGPSEFDQNMTADSFGTSPGNLEEAMGMGSSIRGFPPLDGGLSELSYEGHGDLAEGDATSHEDFESPEIPETLFMPGDMIRPMPHSVSHNQHHMEFLHTGFRLASRQQHEHEHWVPQVSQVSLIGGIGTATSADHIFVQPQLRSERASHPGFASGQQVTVSAESNSGESSDEESDYDPSENYSIDSGEIKAYSESPQHPGSYISTGGVISTGQSSGNDHLQYLAEGEDEDGEYDEDETEQTPTKGYQHDFRFQSIKQVDQYLRGTRLVPKNDTTFPISEADDLTYLRKIYDAMCNMAEATDNEKMLQMWTKMKVRDLEIEVAAWTILKRCKDAQCQDKPLVNGNKPTQGYETFEVRIQELCRTLRMQKTCCKHLLTAAYIDQLVDDPCRASHRICNNRKVNQGKKIAIEAGRATLRLRGRDRPGKAKEESPESSGPGYMPEETDEANRDVSEIREPSPRKVKPPPKRKTGNGNHTKGGTKRRASSKSMYPIKPGEGGKFEIVQYPPKMSAEPVPDYSGSTRFEPAPGVSSRVGGTLPSTNSPYPANFQRSGPNLFDQSTSEHQGPYAPNQSPSPLRRSLDSQIGGYATPQPAANSPHTAGRSFGTSAAKRRKISRRET